MLRAFYQRRIAADLRRWRAEGLITDAAADSIRASVGAPGGGLGMAGILAMAGAVLLGLGVVAFVAANWDATPRIVRLGLCIAALAASYAAAAVLSRRGASRFAEAALVTASLVFAAAIALIGQTYHLGEDFVGALMVWVAGALAAAWLTRSPAVTIVALVGACHWTTAATIEFGAAPHWAGVLPIVVGAAAAVRERSRAAAFVAALCLAYWLALALLAAGFAGTWSFRGSLAVGAAAGLFFWALGAALASGAAGQRAVLVGNALTWPALAGLLLALSGSQVLSALQAFFSIDPRADGDAWLPIGAIAVAAAAVLALVAGRRDRGPGRVHALAVAGLGAAALAFAHMHAQDPASARTAEAAIVLAAALWVVKLGHDTDDVAAKRLGLAALGLEVLYVYTVTIGTLLDTAMALVAGGLLFIGLAVLILAVDRRMKSPSPANPGGGRLAPTAGDGAAASGTGGAP